ncbi:MAG: site-specific integrase [bacterium]
MKASTSIFIDKYHPKQLNKCAISLRVTFERKKKYYSTPFSLTEQEFQKVMFGSRLSDNEKELKMKIQDYENKAIAIIEKLPFFSWNEFEKKYRDNRGAKDIVKLAYQRRIKELRQAGQIGTAITYECAIKSLDKFLPESRFIDFTPEVLSSYERLCIEDGKSKTTIGMYLRTLRSIYNEAISNEDILPSLYPFRRNQYEKGKYEIPVTRNIKKALIKSDIEKIFNYEPKEGSIRAKAKDYWIFIYLTNGLNVNDLCLLKHKNIVDGKIEFIRAKTKNQKKEQKIQAVLLPQSLAIIKKWGNKKKDENSFVFPELSGNETPERQKQLIQQLTHVVNDNMKVIASKLGIEKPVTTYVARHSFATVLKRSGANISLISEMLGHGSQKTTQAYLDSFENDALEKVANTLTDF